MRRNIRIFFQGIPLLMGFLIMTAAGLKAQTNHTLSGKVMDAVSGDVLPGAVIRLPEEGGLWTLTDTRGHFLIKLPQGNHEIEVSYIGYQTQLATVALDHDKDTVFTLMPMSYFIQGVTIFADSPAKRLSRAEMSIERIDAEIIQRVPTLLGEVDLLKVVQMLPGVQAASEGSSGFHVRGGSPDQNMILFDNATLYNVSHMLGFFSIFNSDAVKTMTLYKGDIPARFGGRLSSLLEVIPADGAGDFSVDGGIGLISSRISAQGGIADDRLTFLAAGRRTYADLFLPLAKNEIIKNTTINFYDLNARVKWKVNDKNYLYLSLYNGRDRFRISDMGLKFGNAAAAVNWNYAISDRLFMRLFTTYTNYDYDFQGSTTQMDLEWISRIQDAGLRVDFSYMPDQKNVFEFGVTSNFQWFQPGKAIGTGILASGTQVEQDITMSPRQG
ncbi:MAG: TonB-dependent receptor, partial [Bacteroidales bacterium]|nr:TonB-dependent receptor [Bacteroidales bacterium]